MKITVFLFAILMGVCGKIIIVKDDFKNTTISRPISYTLLRDGFLVRSRDINFHHRQVKIKKVRTCPICQCGLASKNRIVGGENLTYNKYTWMAAMTYFGRYYCVASLINDRYILTAGHCTNGFQRKYMEILFLNYSRQKESPLKRNISWIWRHRDYNPMSLNHDISLLKLSKPVKLGDSLRPVCLPDVGINWNGYQAKVAGWGALQYRGKPSTILNEVAVPIISNQVCRRTVYGTRITQFMLCAGYVNSGQKDACQGDSGGPLMVADTNSIHSLVGIVSWGAGCGAKQKPGVYTRVTKYLKWIQNHTQDACYCENAMIEK